MHSMSLLELIDEQNKINKKLRWFIKAEFYTHIQKVQLIIDYYQEFNEMPDEELLIEARKSLKELKIYIDTSYGNK